MSGLDALARFVRPAARARAPHPACELCSAPLAERHRHLVDLSQRTLQCACIACALLFEPSGAGRYRAVPDRVLADPDRAPTREAWGAAGIPVQLAFVFFSTPAARWVATFPSPAGPTEAEVDRAAWERLRGSAPLLAEARPDVEAVVVRGAPGRSALECYVAPIDVCYRLVGRVRATWQGFSGGDEAHAAIAEVFEELRRRSRPPKPRGGRHEEK